MDKYVYLNFIREQLNALTNTHKQGCSTEMDQVIMGRIGTYLQQENVLLESITAEFLVHSSKNIEGG